MQQIDKLVEIQGKTIKSAKVCSLQGEYVLCIMFTDETFHLIGYFDQLSIRGIPLGFSIDPLGVIKSKGFTTPKERLQYCTFLEALGFVVPEETKQTLIEAEKKVVYTDNGIRFKVIEEFFIGFRLYQVGEVVEVALECLNEEKAIVWFAEENDEINWSKLEL